MQQQPMLDASRDYRDLVRRLGTLGQEPVEAPATLLPTVLARVGLADRYAPLDSFIGPLFVAFNRVGATTVAPAGDPAEFERSYRSRFGRPVERVEAAPAPIAAALQGRRVAGPPRVDLRALAPFQQAVLRKTLEIPRGEVRTYGWVAREIGKPAAVRAVGTALRRNPIPLIIPCHRVVRGDSRVGEYALGSDAKWALLDAEGAEPDQLESLGRAGVRYIGSASTRIYCFPTCRDARRIQERHRVPFRSAGAAASSGYRPCKVCRPAGRQRATVPIDSALAAAGPTRSGCRQRRSRRATMCGRSEAYGGTAGSPGV